jgi:hypothetical protein
MKKPGEFLETKARHKKRQATFDKVKKAKQELETSPTTVLWFRGVKIEVKKPEPYFQDHGLYVMKIKGGYALRNVIENEAYSVDTNHVSHAHVSNMVFPVVKVIACSEEMQPFFGQFIQKTEA